MKSKSYSTVIFDMDGTILNTLDDLAASINHALGVCGFPMRTTDEVRHFVGNGIRLLVERAVPAGSSAADADRVFERFTEHYTIHCADATAPYDGICPLLFRLRSMGVSTAVVSNKADYAVQALAKRYFDGLFDMALGEKAGVRKKPYPDSVNYVMQKLGALREQTLYVGDSDVDIMTAENAHIDCASVTWGFRSKEFLKECGAERFASNACELMSIITGDAIQ